MRLFTNIGVRVDGVVLLYAAAKLMIRIPDPTDPGYFVPAMSFVA